jgi:hypothetical protein
MKISKINKIIIILGAIFIIISVAVAYILLPKEKNSSIAMQFVNDYEIEGQTVKSKEAGFSAVFPEGWIVKNLDSKIGFSNAEVKIEAGKSVVQIIQENNLCSGVLQIKEYASENDADITGLSALISRVKSGEKGKDRDYAYSLVDVNGIIFLRTEFSKEGKVIYISMKAVSGKIIYHIDSGLFFSDDCGQAFDNIIQSVKIN